MYLADTLSRANLRNTAGSWRMLCIACHHGVTQYFSLVMIKHFQSTFVILIYFLYEKAFAVRLIPDILYSTYKCHLFHLKTLSGLYMYHKAICFLDCHFGRKKKSSRFYSYNSLNMWFAKLAYCHRNSPLASHMRIVLSPDAVTNKSGLLGCQHNWSTLSPWPL